MTTEVRTSPSGPIVEISSGPTQSVIGKILIPAGSTIPTGNSVSYKLLLGASGSSDTTKWRVGMNIVPNEGDDVSFPLDSPLVCNIPYVSNVGDFGIAALLSIYNPDVADYHFGSDTTIAVEANYYG